MTSKREIAAFRRIVWNHYRAERRMFPWRTTHDPYKILVSEIMLQQTQTLRVEPKYREFLRRFPTLRALAKATLRDVLIAWQGLGYNRRAKMLHDAAKTVMRDHAGKLPRTEAELKKLPGIGPYTAAAVAAFAYNEPVVLIETNVRTVYTHHFFGDRMQIRDSEIMPLIEETLDRENVREWYFALMDYGAALKSQGVKLNSRSAHYVKQSKFKGSDREIRGAILRMLAVGDEGAGSLQKKIAADNARIDLQLVALSKEGFIKKHKRKWQLA